MQTHCATVFLDRVVGHIKLASHFYRGCTRGNGGSKPLLSLNRESPAEAAAPVEPGWTSRAISSSNGDTHGQGSANLPVLHRLPSRAPHPVTELRRNVLRFRYLAYPLAIAGKPHTRDIKASSTARRSGAPPIILRTLSGVSLPVRTSASKSRASRPGWRPPPPRPPTTHRMSTRGLRQRRHIQRFAQFAFELPDDRRRVIQERLLSGQDFGAVTALLQKFVRGQTDASLPIPKTRHAAKEKGAHQSASRLIAKDVRSENRPGPSSACARARTICSPTPLSFAILYTKSRQSDDGRIYVRLNFRRRA